MAMYSLLRATPDATVAHVEEHLDGNLCRCTGYRPILDAAKSLCTDAPRCEGSGGCKGGGGGGCKGGGGGCADVEEVCSTSESKAAEARFATPYAIPTTPNGTRLRHRQSVRRQCARAGPTDRGSVAAPRVHSGIELRNCSSVHRH